MITAFLIVATVWIFSGSANSQSQHFDGPLQTVRVRSGDTVWAIASRVNGDGDVREMVASIKALNGLNNNLTIVAGQDLKVPVKAK